jgi:hypothetical protein
MCLVFLSMIYTGMHNLNFVFTLDSRYTRDENLFIFKSYTLLFILSLENFIRLSLSVVCTVTLLVQGFVEVIPIYACCIHEFQPRE